MINFEKLFELRRRDLEGLLMAGLATGKDDAQMFDLTEGELLAVRPPHREIFFMAGNYALSRAATPNWIGEFATTSSEFEPITESRALDFAASIASYRTDDVVKNPTYAFPTEAIWYEDWRPITGGVNYPFRIVYRHFIWKPTGLNPDDKTVHIFTSFEEQLEVISVEPIMGDSLSFEADIPEGAVIIDEDRVLLSRKGEPQEEAVGKMVQQNDKPISRTRMILIVGNLVAVVAVILLWRRRCRMRRVEGQGA